MRLELKAELAHLLGRGGGGRRLSVRRQPRRPDARARGGAGDPGAEPREHPVPDLRGLLRARLQARRRGAALPRLRGPALGRRGDARAPRVDPRHDRRDVGRALLRLPPRARARLLAARRARAPALPAPLPGDRGAPAPGRLLARARLQRRRRRAARVGGRAARRALGRQPVLPRGGLPRPRRAGRARAPQRRLGARGLRGRALHPRGRPGDAAGAPRPPRPPDARRPLDRRGHRADVRAAAARAARGPRPAHAGADRPAAARPDRREAPPSEPGVPLPPRPRAGGRLREPRRHAAPQAPQARGRGARGDLQGVAGGGLRAPRPALRGGRRAREGRRLPPEGRRRRPRRLRGQGGARALPQGARVPGTRRRRAPGARHALQDGARLPPRLRLRERRGDVRRGVLVPGRRGPAPAGHREARDRVQPPERAGARATSTRPRPATSRSCSSAGS